MEVTNPVGSRRSSGEHQIQIFNGTQQRQSRLTLFVDRTLVQGVTAVESRAHLVARRTLQGVSIVASLVGRVPFIPLSLKFAGDNTVYGVFLAYGATASFGSLVAYSFLNIIDSQMRPLTEDEHYLLHSRVGPAAKKAFLLCGFILGVGTQIPFAIIAYKYNESSTLNPGGYLMPAMVVAIDSWVSTFSAYMGLRTLGERSRRNPYEKELDVIRGKMLGLIGENQELFALADRRTQLGFIDAYQRIKQVDEAEDRVKQFYTLYTNRITDQTLTPSSCSVATTYVAKTLGYIFAGCNIATMGYVAYLGTNVVGLDVVVTALYVGTSLYLNTTAIPNTAAKLFNLVKDVFSWSYQPTLSDQLSPKLSFALKSLSLATAGLSYGTAMQISHDYYSEHEWLEITMNVTLTSATTCLVSMAMLFIVDEAIQAKIENFGTEEEKQIIEIHQKMKSYSAMLSASPFIDLALHMKAIPPEALDLLRTNTRITLENLEQFIQENMPQHTPATPLLLHE